MNFGFRELIVDASAALECGGDSYCGGSLAMERPASCGGDSYCGGSLAMVRNSNPVSDGSIDEMLQGLSALAD